MVDFSVSNFAVRYNGGGAYGTATFAGVPYDTLIIEPVVTGAWITPYTNDTVFIAGQVDTIRAGVTGREVIGYVNAGVIDGYRTYWNQYWSPNSPTYVDPTMAQNGSDPSWLGGRLTYGAAPSQRYAQFWQPEWKNAVLLPQIDKLLQSGFDGVFLDDLLTYFNWADLPRSNPGDAQKGWIDTSDIVLSGAPVDAAGMAQAMMQLVIDIANYARVGAPNADPDFRIFVNGGAYIINDAGGGATALANSYRDAIDVISQESVLGNTFHQDAVSRLRNDFLNHGVTVLTIDFTDHSTNVSLTPEQLRARVSSQALENGFIPYVTDQSFGVLSTPMNIGTMGKDTIVGGPTNDILSGEGGGDALYGGLGADRLTGGLADDVFLFAFADLQAGIVDRISDYTPGTDSIRFSSSIGGDSVTAAGGNALVMFGNGYQIELTGKAGSVIRLDFTNRWEYWDTGSNAPWSRYTDYLNASGQISDQEIINDNGTLTQRHVDLSPGGTQHAWIEYTDYFSAAPHTLRDQEIRYDNGTIGQRHIGQAGTLEYTDYVTPGGVLLDQEVINLNGTREQRHYDPSNSRSAQWSSYTDFFNAANPAQITAKSMIYDSNGFQDQWHYSTPGSTLHGYVDHFDNLGSFLGRDLF